LEAAAAKKRLPKPKLRKPLRLKMKLRKRNN